MPVGGFEPQTDVRLAIIPADGAFFTAPVIDNIGMLGVPDGANFQLELLSIGVIAVTIPTDTSNPITLTINWCDDSAADAVAALNAAATSFNMLTITALVYNQICRGSWILDPGDSVNGVVTATTPDADAAGVAFIVEYRVLKHS